MFAVFRRVIDWFDSETRLNEAEYVQISRWAAFPGSFGHALFWWLIPQIFQLVELGWARMVNILAFLFFPLLARPIGGTRPALFRFLWITFCTWQLFVFPWIMYRLNDYNQYWLVSLVFFSLLSTVMLRSFDILLVTGAGAIAILVTASDAYHARLGLVFSSITSFASFFGMAYIRYIQQRLVTARMNLASAYKQLQQTNALKDEFMLNVAHELRTPLAVMSAIIDQLEIDKQSKRYKLLIATMNQFSRQTDELLNANSHKPVVLDSTRIDAADFVKDIHEMFSVLAAADGIELRSIVKTKIVFTADQGRLTTAISNLVSNAIKFTKVGGRVAIVMNADYSGHVYIKVKDNGIGIPHDKIKHIFERYYQIENGLARSGFGIGLTLVKDIVDAHNGVISVTSAEDDGTTFIVKLPANAEIIGSKPSMSMISHAQSVKIKSRLGDTTALVVEDNATLRQFIVDVLTDAGLNAIGHESPVTALAFISSSQPKLSLVISDVGLPGMDGYAFIKALRNISGYESTPVVLASGYSRHAVLNNVKDLNASALEKPFNRYQLIEHINTTCNLQKNT
jgi:signal transduction histidine kinase/ActR/RegA family two-component response regulator